MIHAFLEDVSNEITIFAAPASARGRAKSLQKPPAQMRNEWQTLLDSHIDFRALSGASMKVLKAQLISFEDPPPMQAIWAVGGNHKGGERRKNIICTKLASQKTTGNRNLTRLQDPLTGVGGYICEEHF